MLCCSGFNIIQTPEELVAYTINWPARGLAPGVTIVSQVLVGSSDDFTLSNESITGTGTTVTFELTGGIAGNFYSITNTVTLSDGEVWQESVSYQCVAIRPI